MVSVSLAGVRSEPWVDTGTLYTYPTSPNPYALPKNGSDYVIRGTRDASTPSASTVTEEWKGRDEVGSVR